jgi:hypothetical protein
VLSYLADCFKKLKQFDKALEKHEDFPMLQRQMLHSKAALTLPSPTNVWEGGGGSRSGGGGGEYRRASRPKSPKSPIYAAAAQVLLSTSSTCIRGQPSLPCNSASRGLDYTENPGARPALRMGFTGPTTVQTRGLVCSSKTGPHPIPMTT